MAGNLAFGCGQCLPCRINRRRLWQWRMFYESTLHQQNCFVTLTYSDESLPSCGTLVPDHLKAWLKRLRRRLEPRTFKFFAVGEYGDETHRPHYHACLFGVGELDAGVIDATWGHGLTATFEFNEFTAQYTAGYVIKKLTKPDDSRLHGRHPEFSRQSNRPGLGARAMAVLADQLHHVAGLDHIIRTGDVPTHLVIGKRKIPIGRYLRQKLREEMGMPKHVQEETQKDRIKLYEAKLLDLYEDTSFPKGLFVSPVVTQNSILKATQGKIWSAETRMKIHASKKRKVL